MSYIASKMYEIYLENYSKIFPKLKSIKQYNPHNALLALNHHTYLTGDGMQFEDLFPKYIFNRNFSSLEKLISGIENDLNNTPSVKPYDNYKTYCKRFFDFLRIVISPNNQVQKAILKKLIKAYEIDGISELVEVLGGVDKFLIKALENSYFFSPELIKQRFSQIEKMYQNNDPIPARWKEIRKSGIRSQCGYANCDIDTNGNSKVRQVIENMTGYTVSQGQNSVFTNYKISHIWGNAQDPRYFTNLWNIVLVPAWVNDLLDKQTSAKGSIASKVLNTYKSICENYYNIKLLSLKTINLKTTPTASCKSDIIHGNFIFNSIEGKGSESFGEIRKVFFRV